LDCACDIQIYVEGTLQFYDLLIIVPGQPLVVMAISFSYKRPLDVVLFGEGDFNGS
jgi:hypothetical protein